MSVDLNETLSPQTLDNEPIMSLDALNALRLKIVEDDYDPPKEEMAAAVQSIRPPRAKESAPKEKKSRTPAKKVDLSDLL